MAKNAPRPPVLRVDTSGLDDEQHQDVFLDTRKPSHLVPIPPFQVSVEPASPSSPIIPPPLSIPPPPSTVGQLSQNVPSSTIVGRALQETRKLLTHILSQLQHRPMPPSIFGDMNSSTKPVKSNRRDARAQPSLSQGEDDDDDYESDIFTTDTTYDLMLQLKEVLHIALHQGWQIFYDSNVPEDKDTLRRPGRRDKSPFRRSRSGLPSTGKRPRASSPKAETSLQAPELLSQCIAVLSSVILEDCRYKISLPRPSRPPYALQALTLNVALYLIQTQRRDPKFISRVGFTLIPAFSTFPAAMQIRLLTFFEDSIMRGMLNDLNQARGSAGDAKQLDTEPLNTSFVSIQVEEIKDEETTLAWRPWGGVSSDTLYLRSTNAPSQSMLVYHLASLVSPLLATLLESIDLDAPRPELLYYFYRLLNTIISVKADAYLDILGVMAYHIPKARQAALRVLLTFWPRALGHMTISTSLPILSQSYSESEQQAQDIHDAHHFVPWRFTPPSFMVPQRPSPIECQRCTTPLLDFGLFCPLCMSAVHLDCYNDPRGCQDLEYIVSAMEHTATFRFCCISPVQMDHSSSHRFQLVNLFTLCLCFTCRKPLWGPTAQGYRCTICKLFVHPACLSSCSQRCEPGSFNREHLEIDWPTLRRSFTDYYRELLLSAAELKTKSYEEISAFFATLWVQLQIVDSGAASSSTIVKSWAAFSRDAIISEFELHTLLKLYESALRSGRHSTSETLDEYLQENHIRPSDHDFMFDWPSLMYITTTTKSLYDAQKVIPRSTSSTLLDVNPPNPPKEITDLSQQSFERVPLSYMRDALGYELDIHSDAAARLVLSHLHQLGFFDREDMSPMLFDSMQNNEQVFCVFPLPLGLDLSTNVETLICATEACLSDLDLCINEAGFLLLVRKLWPSGMTSEYTLRRVARSVLCWIFAEDESLSIILRDYLAQRTTTPGTRSESSLWPPAPSARPKPSSSDYVAARRRLLSRYVARWLLAVHDLDKTAYPKLLYELCTDISADIMDGHGVSQSTGLAGSQLAKSLDNILRLIMKLAQTSVIFSAFNDIYLMWLEAIEMMETFTKPMASLLRLVNFEVDTYGRAGSIDAGNRGDLLRQFNIDPWNVVKAVASKDGLGLSRALRWLCLFARSGVEIPVDVFEEFSFFAAAFQASLDDGLLFVEAALASSWLRSMGKEEIHTSSASWHRLLLRQVLHCLQTSLKSADALCFIRQSLSACLLLYGCERNTLLKFGMVLNEEVEALPSRRKLNARRERGSDPIFIESDLMTALERYVNANVDELTCIVAQFLHLFLTESPFLERHEADNFILRSAKLLSLCAWNLYDIQRHEISSMRTSFLLRVVAVDPEPFQAILHQWLHPSMTWEPRLNSVTRLFRIVLDVTSPSFTVEGKPWRSNVIHVFYHFFTLLWTDAQEEIRMTVDSWSQALLPAHFEAISACWDEALTELPVAERARLVAFLIQLHPHFPSWQLVSFDSIVRMIGASDRGRINLDDIESPTPPTLVTHTSSTSTTQLPEQQLPYNRGELRVSALLLGLHLIADGVFIDTVHLLNIKVELLRMIGFTDLVAVPKNNGRAFYLTFSTLEQIPDVVLPCLHDLPILFDAAHPFELSPSAMGGSYVEDDSPSPLLVGSAFVDVSLTIFFAVPRLQSLSALTLKSMLESLVIIMYKHDFDSRTLKHLQPLLRKAVRRAMELVLLDISHELRQLALSVTQAFVKKWPSLAGIFVLDSVESAAKVIISLNHRTQDMLVAQARGLIDSTLKAFASNGILNSLCKRHLNREFFIVLKHIIGGDAKLTKANPSEALRSILLRDAFARAPDNESGILQQVLDNLNTFVEVVHHQGYDVELMQCVGTFLTQIVRRTSDSMDGAFDPTSILMLSSTVIQFNKSQSREFLTSLETALRAILLRFPVTMKCLVRVLNVTSTLYRKAQVREEGPVAQAQPNVIAQVVFDTFAEGLRMKVRLIPTNLSSILEALTTGALHPATIPIESIRELADDGLNFLQQHAWSDAIYQNDYDASIAVAKVVLDATDHDPDILARHLADQGGEQKLRHILKIRAWNILVLAALSQATKNWKTNVSTHFSTFTLTYCDALRSFTQTGAVRPEAAEAEAIINHTYAAIKLWLLLAQNVMLKAVEIDSPKLQELSSNESTSLLDVVAVWNELWPHFERLVKIFEGEAESSLATLVWSSVANLFVFARQTQSVLAFDVTSQIALLERLRILSRQESASSQLSRALRNLTEPLPDTPFELLLSQAGKDVVAAERALEVKRKDAAKAVPGRHRDGRGIS